MAKTKYNKTFPAKVEAMAKKGMIDKNMAKSLGISEDTFYEYIKKYPEFSEALKRGKAPIDEEVQSSLLKRALGYSYKETTKSAKTDVEGNIIGKEIKEVVKSVVPDVTAQIFWLKNRMPEDWRDKQDVLINIGADYSGMSTEELIKRAAAVTKLDESKD